jgi:hypothetical protein
MLHISVYKGTGFSITRPAHLSDRSELCQMFLVTP